MKKHLSVLMLIARSTIYKLLALLVLMGGAEGTLYYIAHKRALTGENATSVSLEQVISNSHIAWVFAVFFIIATILLCLTGCEYGSKQGYTLRRLSVSERSIFLWQSMYNAFFYMLLWAVQLGIVLIFCQIYVSSYDQRYISSQTVFLAFYRNSFLHSLLPLEETFRYVRNIALVIGLGITSASFPYRHRKGKNGFEPLVLAVIAIIYFSYGIGGFIRDGFVILITIILTVKSVYRVFSKEGYDEN